MRLYSIQPVFVYERLCDEGRFLPQPVAAVDEWFFADSPNAQLAYDWLCREMEARGLARPCRDSYPVWAWYHYWGPLKPKPDLRYAAIKPSATEGRRVLLSLEVPADAVLLHDYEAWHWPLNHWYLGNQRKSADFERRCKAGGITANRNTPVDDPALRAELEQSWQAIFDLKAARRIVGVPAAEQAVQATFWELQSRHVVGAVEFGHGRRRQKLPLPPLRHPESELSSSA